MASLNDVLQGLINLDSKSITNIKNILESLGNGFIDIGTLSLSNNTLSLQNATILAKGLCKDVSLSTSFSGNKICFLEFKSDKSVAFKVLNTVDANFSYDLSQLKSSSIYFEVARQYNGKYEDIRLSNILTKDNSIIKTLNKLLKDIKDLDSSKIDASYVEQALANLSTYATKTELNNAINGLDATYVTHTEMTNAKYATKTELNNAINGCQKTSDNSLSTTNKTIVGAINELFQSANNGKELIASAIGTPLSSSDTFQAMSDDIESLLSQFKANMRNAGIEVSDSDKFQSLINKTLEILEILEGNRYLESYITYLIRQRLESAGVSYIQSLDTIDLVNAIVNSNISPNRIKDIASSDTMVMVVLDDANNSLYVWGYNAAGQLGLPTTSQSYTTPTLTATNVLSVAAGFNHSFYIDTIGSLYGVGLDNYGKLGGIGGRYSWTYITDNVKKVLCTENTSFILKKDGTLLGCGRNNCAMFGYPSSDIFEINKLVNIASNVIDMAITCNSSYIIKDDGSLWVSGKNSSGQLGVGDKVDREAFTKVNMPNGLKVLKVTASTNHAVVIAEDGYLYCCGDNSDGQLGLSVSECSTFTRYTGYDDIAYPVKDVVAYYNDSTSADSPSQTYVLDSRGHVFVAGYYRSNMGRSILDFSKASYKSNTSVITFTFDNISIPSGYDKYSFINSSPKRVYISAYKANSTTQIFLDKELPGYSPEIDGPAITEIDFAGNSKLKIVLKFYKSDYWDNVSSVSSWIEDLCLCCTNCSSFNYIGLDWGKYVCKVSLVGSSTHLYTSDGKVYSSGRNGYYELMTTDVCCFIERNDIP